MSATSSETDVLERTIGLASKFFNDTATRPEASPMIRESVKGGQMIIAKLYEAADHYRAQHSPFSSGMTSQSPVSSETPSLTLKRLKENMLNTSNIRSQAPGNPLHNLLNTQSVVHKSGGIDFQPRSDIDQSRSDIDHLWLTTVLGDFDSNQWWQSVGQLPAHDWQNHDLLSDNLTSWWQNI